MCYLSLFLSTFLLVFNAHSRVQVDARATRHETTVISDSADGIQLLLTPGTYSYRARNNKGNVAGLYFLAAADDLIKITFTEFDVPCGKSGGIGSLVQYTDGWELNGQVFPIAESSVDPADTEFCSDNPPGRRSFISSQNGALITYRILEVGRGFTVNVEHRKHPSPCNVIFNDESHVVLRNHGSKKNCSYWFPDKVKVKLNSYSVGNSQTNEIPRKCFDSFDRIEIGGSYGLDPNRIEVLDNICNDFKSNDGTEYLIDCSGTTIKLVSSGAYENHLNVTLKQIDPEEPAASTKYQCKCTY